MNRKQFLLLLGLVVLVGAAGWLVRQHSQSSWQSAGPALGRKLLPNLPVNDIAQITIQSGTNELTLARRDGLWRVRERSDYPADFSQISGLLIKFSELKSAQSQEVGASQLGRFELLPPGSGTNSGTRVELKDQNGRTLTSLLLGKKHMKSPPGKSRFGGFGDEGWPDGRYVMVGSGAKTVAVVSDPLENVEPGPERWLNKDFISIEKPRTISAQFPDATNSWKLMRASETNDWQLADARAAEKLDASRLYGITSPFSSPGFNDVLPADTPPQTSGLTNVTVLTVETFDGFTYTAKIGWKQADNYPVSFSIAAHLPAEPAFAPDEKRADEAKSGAQFQERRKQLADKLARERQCERWIYLMPAYNVDPVTKPRAQLLVETNSEPAPASPSGK